jgi:hypothetical protein
VQSATGGPNIVLRSGPLHEFVYEIGSVLRLVSDGSRWVEESRSSGQLEVFGVERNISVPPNQIRSLTLVCSQAPASQAGGAMLAGSMRVTASPGGPGTVVLSESYTMVMNEVAYVATANNSKIQPATLFASIRCILF